MAMLRAARFAIWAVATGSVCLAGSMALKSGSVNGNANAPAPSACVDDSGLKLAPGFCATVFADDIGHARQMVVAPNGALYVNTWSGQYYGNIPPHEGGFLVALEDKSGSGKATVHERFGPTFQEGGHGGTGIGFYNNAIYAEVNDKIVRYALGPAEVVPKGSAETVVSGLPLTGDHPMHPFLIDAKGTMFVDVASASNSCQLKNRTLKSPGAEPCTEQETRGGIWKYDANKTDQKFSAADRYATGIRNGEGLAMDASGRLFVTQHGRDQLHANWPELYKPEEEATLPAEELLQLKQGGDYGWPECYYDPYSKKLMLAPEYGGDGGKKIGVCGGKTEPVAVFPAHWAPNALLHYDKKEFPARYQNGMFIAFHGSWNRSPYAQGGYNVVFQPMADGKASGRCEIFADGFAGAVKTPEEAAHRPTGLAVGPDGAMYVSDDVHGRIYRIVYVGGASAKSGKVMYCPDATAPAGKIVEAEAKPPEGTNPDVAATASALPEGATPQMVALGEKIYRGQVGGAACTGCHGLNGQGAPLGPPLNANKWVWSDGSLAGIAKTITDGVQQPKNYRSTMPAMGGAQLTHTQVMALAAYVWTLSHQDAKTSSNGSAPAELKIPGDRIFPESLTSTSDGRIMIGTITGRTIFLVKPGESAAEPWIKPDGDTTLGIIGVFADEASNTLWSCHSPLPGTHGDTPATLKAYDLKTGEPKGRYPLPTTGAFCNDIAVGSDGTAYVTDTENMEVVRLAKGGDRLEVWAGNGAFGPKGKILDGISVLGNRVIVNVLETNKLFAVPIGADGNAGTVTEVKLDRAIDNPDGMRSFGSDGLLIVEGGGKGRLSKIKISGDTGQVTPLKEGYPGGPTAVTVVGTTGYVLEGQLDVLFGPSGGKGETKPFHATAVEVGRP